MASLSLSKNFFRFLGDILAVSSKLVILRKINNTQSLSGLSLKTQILYLVTYIFRYINLFSLPSKWDSMEIYNTAMKIIYILFQVYLVSLFYGKYKYSYPKRYDTFNIPIFILVSLPLGFYFRKETDGGIGEILVEGLYTCSLILESLAILPQLVVSQDSGECEKLTAVFITLLGLYRVNYLVHFFVRIYKGAYIDPMILVTAGIQSILYFDFYRVYFGFIKKSG